MSTNPALSFLLSQWTASWKKPSFRRALIVTIVCIYGLMVFAQVFLAFAEGRNGTVLNDYLLQHIPSTNVSWVIFSVIYVSIFWALCSLSFHPHILLRTLQAFVLLTAFRLSCIYLFPLNPPAGMVMLVDPLLDYFVYDRNVITKDLFFSGHTSSVFLFYFAVGYSQRLKWTLLFCGFAVGALLLIQHAHYTIDVLAAPFFSWLAFWIINSIDKKINNKSASYKSQTVPKV